MVPPAERSAETAGKPRRPYAPRMAPERRREQVLDAALRVILELGYSGVSIEAIAREAGVTRPVIYDHFANLAQLLGALIEREERYALGQLEEVLPLRLDNAVPGQTLPSSIRRLLEEVRARPDTWRLILLPPAGTPSIVRQHVERNRGLALERIESMVRAATQWPELPPTFDVELAARAILDLSEEAGRMVLTEPDRFSPERYERFVASLTGLIWPQSAPETRQGPDRSGPHR
jgi:AcrR family transcriptional regulator